jgi:hypothetical protein
MPTGPNELFTILAIAWQAILPPSFFLFSQFSQVAII